MLLTTIILLFHSDHGNEYNNVLIDNILSTFNIERSLIIEISPYDNAVSKLLIKF